MYGAMWKKMFIESQSHNSRKKRKKKRKKKSRRSGKKSGRGRKRIENERNTKFSYVIVKQREYTFLRTSIYVIGRSDDRAISYIHTYIHVIFYLFLFIHACAWVYLGE